MTEEDIVRAYNYHLRPGVWWMCSRMNPIALALKRLGFGHLLVGYESVYEGHQASTYDGMPYLVGRAIFALPENARSFLRQFGYSLSGKESKRAFETRKSLRRTSSDHKVPVVAAKENRLVEPFEFELELDD